MPRLVAVWLALAAVYVLFVGSLSANEAAAGAACAGLGTAWWAFVARPSSIRFHMSGGVLRMMAAPVRALPASAVRIGADLARAVSGGLRHGSVRPLSDAETEWARAEGASASASRAVGLLAASLTPDSYVLGLDSHGTVVAHALSADGAEA